MYSSMARNTQLFYKQPGDKLFFLWINVLPSIPPFVAVQSLYRIQIFVTPWTAAHQALLSSTISQSLLKFLSTESVMLSNATSFFCLQSFPASGFFPMSRHFASSGQNIWASTSASVLPMNFQDWFPLWLTGLITLQSKELSRVFSSTTNWKHQLFGTSSYWKD